MKKIELPCYGIVVETEKDGGCITSTLHETSQRPCSTEDAMNLFQFNSSIDGIESLILALACAGVDVTTPAFIEGIESAVEACSNFAYE